MSSEAELLWAEALDDGAVTEVIRPSAILPEHAARTVLVELAVRDVRSGGLWHATPTLWRRYEQPWTAGGTGQDTHLLGSMQVAYGTPTRYDITIYRATITVLGQQAGWTVASLCDEALGFGGLTLEECPRAQLRPPPPRFPRH